MKKIIKKILGKRIIKILSLIKNKYIDKYAMKIYSMEGEDVILKRFLLHRKNGFYIDIGAHHPYRFSNTFLFYKEGWKGINIDAMPDSMKLFNRFRKRDINLEIGISKKRDILTYFMFDESALNGFSTKLSEKYRKCFNNRIIDKKYIRTYPLKEILNKYLSKNQHIDFMNIDIEGLDFEVLKSNDWDKYKPDFIIIEILKINLTDVLNDSIYKYLLSKNYILVAKTRVSCIFKMVEE